MTHSTAAIPASSFSAFAVGIEKFALLPKLFLFMCTTLAAVGPLQLVQSSSSSQSAPINSSPFLDVFLRVEPVDDFCGALQCNITYAISVLTNTQNQFDLQSVMLQDGHMTRRMDSAAGRYFFEENTVVRLSEQLRRAQEKIYLGVMFFDVPDDFQDYLVVEVSDVIQQGRRAKTEFSSDAVKIGIQVYRRNEAISTQIESTDHNGNFPSAESHHPHSLVAGRHHHLHSRGERRLPERVCTCAERNCGCCEQVTVRKIHLDDEVCVNVTYISEDIGVRLALSVDNHIYYSKELSLRNPPPVCFEVPHLRQYASICVRLYNMELRDDRVTGCSEIEAILLHVRVARHKIGCFSIPI